MLAIAFDPGVPPLVRYFFPYTTYIARAKGGLGNVWSGNSYAWSGAGGWQFEAGDSGFGDPGEDAQGLVYAVRPAKVLAFTKGAFSHTSHRFPAA